MGDELQRQFGERLVLLRKAAGFTQAEMAAPLNITREAYSYYESGKTAPSLETLRRLLRVLRMEDAPGYLLLLDRPAGQSCAMVADTPVPPVVPAHVGDLAHEERVLVARFRAMDHAAQDKLFEVLSRLTDSAG